jgi:uncharacterized protein (TIGR02145 family)
MKKIISCMLVIMLVAACQKKGITDQKNQELTSSSSSLKKGASGNSVVTTAVATFITSATATSGGNVSSGGGGNNVIERGVCYNTSSNPTVSNFKVASGSGAGNFVSILSGLSGSTTYYVRAYAVKSTGVNYGNQVVFTTLQDYGTITDADGNLYHTITIGSQVWTVENLKTTKYRDGTSIPNVTDNTDWYNLTTGAYCNYNNDETNVATYGRLYNWAAVTDAHNLAPPGWHVPSYTEWYTTLMNSLGGCSVGGKKLKDNVLWNGDNSSGFKALPAGRRYSGNGPNGPATFFSAINSNADWWTSTPTADPALAWFFEQTVNDGSCSISSFGGDFIYNKKTGYSVRLVKD